MDIATYGPGDLHERFVEELQTHGFTERIGHWDALTLEERRQIRVLFGWRIPQDVVDACPRLEWIQGAGAGVDWLLPVSLPSSVVVTRIIDRFGPDMGEYALMAALSWVKDWRRLNAMQQAKQWQPYLVGQLSTLSVGVLGAGSIGSHIATMFLPLVAEVRAMGRRRPDIPGVRGFSEDQWEAFYQDLDLLVMVLPHTPNTFHLVGDAQIERMRPGGYVINVGRGAVLDQDALERAIHGGQLSGAALDVFETEPLPADSPLWDSPGVTVTPHISGPSRTDGMAEVFLENLARFRSARPLLGVVDMGRGY